MISKSIRERLERSPFEPFVIRSSSGEAYVVDRPHAVALLKSEVFIAMGKSDEWVQLPYLHIAAIESRGSAPGRSAQGRTRKH
jgi:hypothetical protein